MLPTSRRIRLSSRSAAGLSMMTGITFGVDDGFDGHAAPPIGRASLSSESRSTRMARGPTR
jgi:hypothetical protein